MKTREEYLVEAARQSLHDAVYAQTISLRYDTGDSQAVPEYADLRGQHIPELPEAACREGIPYLAEVTEPTGRKKVTLGAAPPDLVRRFLDGEVVPGLSGYYGDPERGFAGGYLT